MRFRIKPIPQFVWLSLLCAPLLAQSAQPNETARNQRQVSDYVEQLQATLSDLENECAKNTARVQLAKLLWGQNETPARQLLEESFKASFKASFKPSAEKDSCAAQGTTALGLEILEFAALRDAAWALQLIESLPEPPTAAAQAATTAQPNLRLSLYQQLALRLQSATTEKAKDALAAVLSKLPKVEPPYAESADEADPSFEADASGLSGLSLFRTAAQSIVDWQTVAAQALQQGDFNQVFNLLDKIRDPQARLHFQALAELSAISATLVNGNDAEAWQRAVMLTPIVPRAHAFVRLAQTLGKRKGPVRAVEALLSARQSIAAEKDNEEKLLALLALAKALVELDADQAFELTQTALETFNSLDSERAHTDGDMQDARAELRQVLVTLAQKDFDRTWGLTSTIRNREQCWFTKIAICQETFATELDTRSEP